MTQWSNGTTFCNFLKVLNCCITILQWDIFKTEIIISICVNGSYDIHFNLMVVENICVCGSKKTVLKISEYIIIQNILVKYKGKIYLLISHKMFIYY